jgi:cellobiose phosphorylase
MKRLLVRPKGVQICWPSYTEVEPDVGLISRCVPGKKENGAIFNHASAWAVLSFLVNDDVEYGVDIYRRMLPIHTSQDIDRYEVEPYVFAEYITSPDHPTEGQASHSWLTGTAVWMLRIGTDFILGLRPELGGLRVDPRIPSEWKEFRFQRRFRGKTVRLHVKNPAGATHGVAELSVNGKTQKSTLLRVEDFEDEVLDLSVVLGGPGRS